jgi:tRNA dimethylallyltransferase
MQILDKNEILFIRNNKKIFDPDFLSVRQLMLEKKFMPVICGPTCTGKSILSFNLGKIFETDIISIDSMQVYKGLDIGTDKYDSSKIGIKQYMTDIFEPDHKLTVVEFRDICRNIIEEEFFKKGKIPVMAGGSGLYLRAVIDELDFTIENNNGTDSDGIAGEHTDSDGTAGKERSASTREDNNGGSTGNDEKKIREELYSQAESSEGGLLGLYIKLMQVDPLYAAKISPNDKKRIIRAIEVHTLTGHPFSSFQDKWQTRKSIYNCIIIGLLTQKEMLHANIEKRVDRMFGKGLIHEVKVLTEQGYNDSNSLMQAVGYKEVLRYLDGDIDIDMCRQEIIKNTKRLAKKQMTWFKADPRINWIRTDNYDNIFDLIEHVFDIFHRAGF